MFFYGDRELLIEKELLFALRLLLWIAILYINHISTVFYSHLFTLNLPASWLQSEGSCNKSKYILGQSFQIRVAAGPIKDNVCGEFQMLLKSWNIAHWLYSIFRKVKNTVFSKVWCRDALYHLYHLSIIMITWGPWSHYQTSVRIYVDLVGSM